MNTAGQIFKNLGFYVLKTKFYVFKNIFCAILYGSHLTSYFNPNLRVLL